MNEGDHFLWEFRRCDNSIYGQLHLQIRFVSANSQAGHADEEEFFFIPYDHLPLHCI